MELHAADGTVSLLRAAAFYDQWILEDVNPPHIQNGSHLFSLYPTKVVPLIHPCFLYQVGVELVTALYVKI